VMRMVAALPCTSPINMTRPCLTQEVEVLLLLRCTALLSLLHAGVVRRDATYLTWESMKKPGT